MGPTVGLFGFLARVNTVSTEKLYACTALLICNIRPLKVKESNFHTSFPDYIFKILTRNTNSARYILMSYVSHKV